MKKIVAIGIGVLFIWFSGAGIMGIVYDVERKRECIDKEGWLKGWLWCDSDPKTPAGAALYEMGNFTRGLAWPVKLFSAGNQDRVEKDTLGAGEVLAAPDPGSAAENLKKFEAIIRQCGYDPETASAAEKECIIRESNKLAGKDTYREAYCHRQASTYESFAKVRDSGTTLNAALNALDKAAPGMVKSFASGSGIQLNEERVIQEAKQAMRHVYAHPEKPLRLLYYDQYYACLAGETTR